MRNLSKILVLLIFLSGSHSIAQTTSDDACVSGIFGSPLGEKWRVEAIAFSRSEYDVTNKAKTYTDVCEEFMSTEKKQAIATLEAVQSAQTLVISAKRQMEINKSQALKYLEKMIQAADLLEWPACKKRIANHKRIVEDGYEITVKEAKQRLESCKAN